MFVNTLLTAALFKFLSRRFAILLLAAAMCCTSPAPGAELQTGRALRQTLEQSIDAVNWSGKPLRGALDRIVETQHIAVMLDRRIDPDQEVEFRAAGIPLHAMIEQLARKHDAGVCEVGDVLYVGPIGTAELLATVVEQRRDEIRKLPASAAARLSRKTPWQWNRLTTPRELLDELQRQYRVKITGKENMPHDLWPAVQLPPMGLAEKLSLVLAGFDVTFQVSPDGGSVRLMPMPKSAVLNRRYDAGAGAARLASQLTSRFPNARIRAAGDELIVDGRFEVHAAIARLLAGERVRPRPPRDTGEKNYTLTVKNKPVGGVMKALGQQLGKTVEFNVKVQRRLTKEISVDVKEVSLDELITAVLASTGLTYEIAGERILISD